MEFRSTQSRYVHFQGDVVSNVSSGGVENSSHGVHLTGGSTGGIVTAAGDETNVTLNVRGKGTGAVVIGNSSSPAAISSGANIRIGSTLLIGNIGRFIDTAVSTPALFNDTDAGRVAETTHAITGLSSQTYGSPTNHFIQVTAPNLPAAVAVCGAYVGSTADQVHVRLVKGSTVAVAATTCTFNFLITQVS